MVHLEMRLWAPVGALTVVVALGGAMSVGPALAEGAEAPGVPVVREVEAATTTTATTTTTRVTAAPVDPVETTSSPTEEAPDPAEIPGATPTETSPTSSTSSTSPTSSTGVDEPSDVVETTTSTEPVPAKATEEQLPDLRVTVVLDRPVYDFHDPIGVRISVENVGPVPATTVRGFTDGHISIDSWGELGYPGMTVGPGERAEFVLTGRLARFPEGPAETRFGVRAEQGDANPADNEVTISVAITVEYGSVAGIAYGDWNRNNAVDLGEALAGVTVQLNGGSPWITRSATTDVSGRFTLSDVPVGGYWVYCFTSNWLFSRVWVTVDEATEAEVFVRGTQAVAETLAASIALSKDSYSLGEIARLTVTLTNSGTAPISGITASSTGLESRLPEWGDLAHPGVTVPAGETRVFHVYQEVPRSAYEVGNLWVRTTFNTPPLYEGGATAAANAKVPGCVVAHALGALRQTLMSYPIGVRGGPAGPPLPNTKVYLRSQEDGTIVARAISDQDGYFEFTNIPADLYDVGIVGPWQLLPGYDRYQAREGGDRRSLWAQPGPYQPDPDPPRPQGGVGPATGIGGGDGELAWTGASVGWLALGGLLTLVTGFALVLWRGRGPVT